MYPDLERRRVYVSQPSCPFQFATAARRLGCISCHHIHLIRSHVPQAFGKLSRARRLIVEPFLAEHPLSTNPVLFGQPQVYQELGYRMPPKRKYLRHHQHFDLLTHTFLTVMFFYLSNSSNRFLNAHSAPVLIDIASAFA